MAPPSETVTPCPIQSHLGPSNFTIAQDSNITTSSMGSIFKKDYPAHAHYGRAAEARPPKLGDVMHKDDRYFNEKASETVKSFEFRHLPKPVLYNVHTRLSATNFKMDSDVSKVNSFNTTHDFYFKPQMGNGYERVKPTQNTTETHIPQGDRDKALAPVSDYRDKFQGHDTTIFKTEKAPPMHEGGAPTIKGDERLSHFYTTQGEQFPGRWQPRIPTLPAPTGTNVPNGDTEKVIMRETTTSASFPYRGDPSFCPYNREEVSKKLLRTNLKHHDGHGTWNDYLSVNTTVFKPKKAKVVRFYPAQHRNHSDFPEGDREPQRVSERVSMTTNRFYHGNPPRGVHNTIISGANLRTRSNVSFGPTHSETYYSTQTNDVFQPKSVPYIYDRQKFYKNSDVPINYYPNLVTNPTAWTDYQNPEIGKTLPSADALDNMKKSHIFPPLKEQMFFHTTHQDLFTPKTSEKYTYDSGRLQKSSVPLGTLSV